MATSKTIWEEAFLKVGLQQRLIDLVKGTIEPVSLEEYNKALLNPALFCVPEKTPTIRSFTLNHEQRCWDCATFNPEPTYQVPIPNKYWQAALTQYVADKLAGVSKKALSIWRYTYLDDVDPKTSDGPRFY